MGKKLIVLPGNVLPGDIMVDDPRLKIPPQPEPTSPRIKELLSRGLTAPETLTPAEVQEMVASVVYHLITKQKD